MKRRSLRTQMLAVLLVMITIMAVFGHVLVSCYERQYTSKLLEMNADVTKRLADQIATQLESLGNALESFSVNATVNRFLATDSELEKLNLMPMYESMLQAYKTMNPGLYSIVLKWKDGSVFSDPDSKYVLISDTRPAFEQLEAGAVSALIVSRGSAYIALKRDVYESGKLRSRVGSCMFVILSEAFTGKLQTSDNSCREIFVLNQEGRVIACNSDGLLGEMLPGAYQAYLDPDSDALRQVQDSKYIAVSQSISSAEWTVLCVEAKETVFSELTSIKLTTYLLLFSMLLVVSVVYMIQEIGLTSALKRFIVHINAISEGRQVGALRLHDTAEFYQLAEAFNHMMMQLSELNEKNLAYHEKILLQDLENKQSQLLALQSQINPHFLYNTLECINSAGAVCGSREVEEMTTALASIFRYAIKGESTVTLREELESLQDYLTIQQIRFPHMFTVHYDIPGELYGLQMLKLLLQPVVENCIAHGFRNSKRPCRIHMKAALVCDKLLITIRDNGSGIPSQTLRRLRDELEHQARQASSIGLINIQRRIRLYYGDAYTVEVSSVEGSGTTVTLVLPIIAGQALEEAPYV